MEEEKPPVQLSTSLITHCTLTICDEISSDCGKLHTLLTNTLKFKIIKVEPLVIEKDCPSPDDIYTLLDALKDLQHLQNRKNCKSVEHHRDSIELEQKKVNIPCDSSVQISSLQSIDENRQLTDCSMVNYCEVNISYEVASQQAQGSNDEISDLTNNFQSLKVNDVSYGHDHVQEHKEFANNLNGNTLRELISVPQKPENESIALRENVTGAEKQKEYCEDVGEEKKQIETTQQKYLTKQGNVVDHCSANVQTMQNTPTATENEMKHNRNHKQEQDGQYIGYSSKYGEESSTDTHEMDAIHTKLTAGKKTISSQIANISKEVNKQSDEEKKNEDCESGFIENSYRKTTDCIKCDKDRESTNKIIAAQNVITSKQSPCRQDNVTEYSSSEVQKIKESERQVKIDKQVHSQGVKTDQGNCGILMTNARTDMNPENIANEMPHVIFEDAKINKKMNMQMHEGDKEEDHNMISTDLACTEIDTRKRDNNCTVIVDDNHDILNQEHLSKHQDFASRNMQILTLKDGGNKRKILKQGDVGASKILSSADSSDSDAESQHNIIYSMKASSLDGIRMYFKGLCNDKYFDDVKKDGTSFTFKLTLCEEDVSFLNKLKQIKIEECKFDQKDKIYFNLAVKDIQSQVREIIAYITDNYVHIVGLKDSVISAKKKLQDIVTNYKSTATRTKSLDKNSPFTQTNLEKSRISDYDKTYKSGGSQKLEDNEMPLSHDDYISSPSTPEDHYAKQKADKTTYSGDNKHDIFSKTQGIYSIRNERRQLKVQISNADITKLEVDCIVNAANKRLQHGGGVARVISEAAGPALKKECEDFILSGNQVDVTDIFVSTGGKMPAKWVMHAVGPKWEAYDNKAQCFEDLRHTVIRCLVEAGRRGFTSIALPSISAAIFKVPKEECARCYMEAVKHFGLFKEQTFLLDIHFVDVDNTMVKIIQEHFQENWTKSCDPKIVQKDCEFAKRHIYTGNRNAAKNIENFTPSSSVSTKTLGASKASSDLGSRLPIGSTVASPSEMRTGRSSAYLIGKFTVRTDTRPAFNLSADITITVGKPFDKLSGLYDFNVSSNKQKKQGVKNIYQMYEVSKPKSSQQKKLCSLLPEPDDPETIKQSIGNLEAVIQSPNHKKFMETVKNVVLTSSILYSEPYKTPKKDKKNTYDRKKVGNFAKCLFDYLQRASGVTASTITLVGSEDALQNICKVIESRGVKKITTEARTSFHQGGGSRRGDNSDHQPSYSSRNLVDDKWNDNEANSSSHHGATSRNTTRGDNSDHQQTNFSQYARSLSDDKQYGNKDAGSSVDLETCDICIEQKPICPDRCCGKYLCQDCKKKMVSCPFCRKFWRVLFGNQPPGTMAVHVLHDYASGYESFRVLEIKYSFPPGYQEACHPNPGEFYRGINRTTFLPMNNEGFDVLMLLRIAFLRRLTFTIGRSLTTEKENSITWNDIHHKTSLHGGPHGFPDSNYLFNVTYELANKGVTFDTISAAERDEIDFFKYHISKFGFFIDVRLR